MQLTGRFFVRDLHTTLVDDKPEPLPSCRRRQLPFANVMIRKREGKESLRWHRLLNVLFSTGTFHMFAACQALGPSWRRPQSAGLYRDYGSYGSPGAPITNTAWVFKSAQVPVLGELHRFSQPWSPHASRSERKGAHVCCVRSVWAQRTRFRRCFWKVRAHSPFWWLLQGTSKRNNRNQVADNLPFKLQTAESG